MTKAVFGLALFLLTALPRAVFADPIPIGGVGQNVSVVGYSNLDDRPGFKMSIVGRTDAGISIWAICGISAGLSSMSRIPPTRKWSNSFQVHTTPGRSKWKSP